MPNDDFWSSAVGVALQLLGEGVQSALGLYMMQRAIRRRRDGAVEYIGAILVFLIGLFLLVSGLVRIFEILGS